MKSLRPQNVSYYRSTLAAERARERALELLSGLPLAALVPGLLIVSLALYQARREIRRLRAGVAQEACK